jgi:type II secretory pathway pseudopilin PulG
MTNGCVRDETGVALPVAIMVMVLVGVMGAGLLVFVRNDLDAVVEVNQGQRAFEIAEAGIQAAKTQQLSDVVRRHYDRDHTNDCTSGQIRATAEDWSPNTTIYSDPRNCSSTTTTRAAGGVTRNFAGGRFNVTIECFAQGDTVCIGGESAPENVAASQKAFFKITSTGYYPADGSGARRKIEAIYYATRLDVPTAYYTPEDIEFNGSPVVAGVSFFAGGNIRLGNADIDRTTPALYRDWDTTNAATFSPTSNLNTQPRRTGPNITDPTVEAAGFGAEGWICRNTCSSASDSIALGTYDYDSTTGTKGSQKQFVRKSATDVTNNVANAAGKITYPFDPYAEFDLTLLESIAREQGNYHQGNIDIVSTTTSGSNRKYPSPSSDQTVFYVKANGATIDYFAGYTPQAKGLIVIENGNFEISNSSTGFDGVVIVTGDGTSTGLYKNTGNKTVKGFVVADGLMTIGGGVEPFSVIGDYTQRPGFFKMKSWSWRECYNTACN